MMEITETGTPPVHASKKALINRRINIVYWLLNILTAFFFSWSALRELTLNPVTVENNIKLGYPEYLLYILATAKIAGVIVLLLPKWPRLKEWAYAGFFIDVIGAFWSESAIGDHTKSIKAFIVFIFLVAFYLLYRKKMELSQK